MRPCQATHLGRPLDLAALDGGEPPRDPRAPYAFIIVPGFTPRLFARPGLHPRALDRLERALAALAEGLAPAVIVSGAAVHSPENEAVLMRAWLLDRGVEPRRIVLEPCARHTTTNLRNAGRIVLASGGREALIVTSDPGGLRTVLEQGFYLGNPWLSGFHARCLVELGHTVGELRQVGPGRIAFRPSRAVLRDGDDPRRPSQWGRSSETRKRGPY